MSVIDIRKDPENLTMTITAEFDAAISSVWQLWADPRKLERWWGPPTYPATVLTHDLTVGGKVEYKMTGPEGDEHRGFWDVVDIDPPNSIMVVDGFADADGIPLTEMPSTKMIITLHDREDGGTRVLMSSIFPSIEQMEQLLQMGMEEGIREAMSQMDTLLAE